MLRWRRSININSIDVLPNLLLVRIVETTEPTLSLSSASSDDGSCDERVMSLANEAMAMGQEAIAEAATLGINL